VIALIAILGVACFLVGMGIEAWLGGAHTGSLEHEVFLLEIENARLKREGK
jgi:hypothetical protein